jgi:hypothetical protein
MSLATGRRWRIVLAFAALVLLTAAPSAVASRLHPIATGVIAFSSDGTRYVAWEGQAKDTIFMLDTRTGRRKTINAPCPLDDKAPAAAGRFLLGCSTATEEHALLLDARTMRTTVLPGASYLSDGLHGAVWHGVGRYYVIGSTGVHARCDRLRRHEDCVALFDIATGVMSEVPEWRVPDVDRTGAPPLCHALRENVRHMSQGEFVSDWGPLIPLGSYFSYRDGLVARPEGLLKREIPNFVKHLIIERCHGPSILVPAHSERRQPHSAWHLELSGGTLTWDTAPNDIWAVSLWEEEEEARLGRELESTKHPAKRSMDPGTLIRYNLHTHESTTWPLPVVKLHLTVEFFRPLSRHVSGIFGYSAHTDYEVFWIATTSLSCPASGDSSGGLSEEHCDDEAGHIVSSIYGARL